MPFAAARGDFWNRFSDLAVQQFTLPRGRSVAAFTAVFGKFVNDRAIGAVVAMAILRQIAQRIGHILKLAHFRFQLLHMAESHFLHIGGGAVPVAPQRQKLLI